MTKLADRTTRLVALAAGLLLTVTACSSSDDRALEDVGASTEATVSSTTTTVSTTTTTEETTTTLSELQMAEAEVEQVVIDWWTFPLDTSIEGNAEERRAFTTGLLYQRNKEGLEAFEADGQIVRIVDPPIEITDTIVDLDEGTAEVTACNGSTGIFTDAETGDVLLADDPEDTNIATIQLQLIDGQWKINEYLATSITDDPIPCEVTP